MKIMATSTFSIVSFSGVIEDPQKIDTLMYLLGRRKSRPDGYDWPIIANPFKPEYLLCSMFKYEKNKRYRLSFMVRVPDWLCHYLFDYLRGSKDSVRMEALDCFSLNAKAC